jgi:hypothetical protein
MNTKNTILKPLSILAAAACYGRTLTRLANEARSLAMIGLANEVSEGEWIQITPKGEFPHEKGIQRIDDAAITALANSFNSIAAKMARRFGGAPIFIGHPDAKRSPTNTGTRRRMDGSRKWKRARTDCMGAWNGARRAKS